MARRIAEMRAGGSRRAARGDAPGRDSAVFDQVLNGLRNGSGDIAKVTNAAARSPRWNQAPRCGPDEEGPRRDPGQSQNLFGAQASATALANGSDKLLATAKACSRVHLVRLAEGHQHLGGNIWVSVLSGLLVLSRSAAWSGRSRSREQACATRPPRNSTTATRRRSCACWTKWVRSRKAT
jgi:twitching motility protein PilJ